MSGRVKTLSNRHAGLRFDKKNDYQTYYFKDLTPQTGILKPHFNSVLEVYSSNQISAMQTPFSLHRPSRLITLGHLTNISSTSSFQFINTCNFYSFSGLNKFVLCIDISCFTLSSRLCLLSLIPRHVTKDLSHFPRLIYELSPSCTNILLGL